MSKLLAESRSHSLYKVDADVKYVKAGVDNNDNVLYHKHTTPDTYRLYVGEFERIISADINILNHMADSDETENITLYVSSHGGSIVTGAHYINRIKASFSHINTEVSAVAYSMGALMFLIGEHRTASESCSVMVHNYSTTLRGKGGEVKDKCEHLEKWFVSEMKTSLVDPGYITESEYQEILCGKDMWFTTKELCVRGMATHVRTADGYITADEFLNPDKYADDTSDDEDTDKSADAYVESNKSDDADVESNKSDDAGVESKEYLSIRSRIRAAYISNTKLTVTELMDITYGSRASIINKIKEIAADADCWKMTRASGAYSLEYVGDDYKYLHYDGFINLDSESMLSSIIGLIKANPDCTALFIVDSLDVRKMKLNRLLTELIDSKRIKFTSNGEYSITYAV